MKIREIAMEEAKKMQAEGWKFQLAGTQTIFGYLKTQVVKVEGQYYTIRRDNK